VDELAVVVDLSGEVRVILVGRFEHDLRGVLAAVVTTRDLSSAPWSRS
jgi:hypothetical protein